MERKQYCTSREQSMCQLLINALTVQVDRPEKHISGNATYQALEPGRRGNCTRQRSCSNSGPSDFIVTNYFGIVFRSSEFGRITSEIGTPPSASRDSSRKPPSTAV